MARSADGHTFWAELTSPGVKGAGRLPTGAPPSCRQSGGLILRAPAGVAFLEVGMSTPSDGEIKRFFENLEPANFTAKPRPTTDFKHADEDLPHHGSDMFEQFVLRHLSQTDRSEVAYFAVIHNGNAWRFFEMSDETLAEFMTRITIASVSFGTKWLFLAVPGEASMGGMFNPDDPESIQRARNAGMMLNVTNWYAESIEPTNEAMRYGIVMDDDDKRQIIESTAPNGANPAFRTVLRLGRQT